MSKIRIAQRKNAKLRLGISGTSGSGKTYSSLVLAALFGGRIGLIDSERGSASLYAGEPGIPEFRVLELDTGASIPDYRNAISEMATEECDVLIVDSLSHSWAAALEVVDRAGGWIKAGKVISPALAGLTQALLSYPGHVICTMRSKTEYAIEKDEKTGKSTMRKLGLAPQVRGDTEYEFTIVLDLTRDGTITVSKSRCGDALPMDHVYDRNRDLLQIGKRIKAWLGKGGASLESEAIERIKFADSPEALAVFADWMRAQKAAGNLTGDLGAISTAYAARKQALASEVVPD